MEEAVLRGVLGGPGGKVAGEIVRAPPFGAPVLERLLVSVESVGLSGGVLRPERLHPLVRPAAASRDDDHAFVCGRIVGSRFDRLLHALFSEFDVVEPGSGLGS